VDLILSYADQGEEQGQALAQVLAQGLLPGRIVVVEWGVQGSASSSRAYDCGPGPDTAVSWQRHADCGRLSVVFIRMGLGRSCMSSIAGHGVVEVSACGYCRRSGFAEEEGRLCVLAASYQTRAQSSPV
jgi:hypothetical protein